MNDFIQFWTEHTPIFSILIPAITAFILVLLGNPGSGSLAQDWRQPWRRGASVIPLACWAYLQRSTICLCQLRANQCL